jgi:hypothetical protein
MTHTPVAVRPILSPDGGRIACPDGEGVWLIDGTGTHRASTVHAVELASWGSTGVVVGGARTVSSLAPDGRVMWTRTFPGEVAALAVADGVLAVALTGGRSTVELVDPVTAESTGSIDVGAGVFEGLLATPDAVLFWGFAESDEDADTGVGPWFARLVSTAGDEWWAGEGAPAEPQGILWPLSSSGSDRRRIGVFDVSTLRILHRADDAWTVLDTRPWPGRGLSASSPGGRYIATLTADWNGTDDAYSVRVVDLHAAATVFETAIDEPGQFPTVAVDDDAHLTLASGISGTDVSVLTLTVDGRRAVTHTLR